MSEQSARSDNTLHGAASAAGVPAGAIRLPAVHLILSDADCEPLLAA